MLESEKFKIPYVLVVPNFITTSAGIKAMHTFCDRLNRMGCTAFVTSSKTSASLLTPKVSQTHLDYWNHLNIAPIVIYPETVSGNPMQAKNCVRYIMNFPGLLGGDPVYQKDEFLISWAKGMTPRSNLNAPERVLYIPVVDRTVFNLNGAIPFSERSGSSFYWNKYKSFHHGKLDHFESSSVEIKRGAQAQSPQEIAQIFKTHKYFYCYENSMLSLEATLCGCLVVLIPNEHFSRPIGDQDLGLTGIAWGQSAPEIENAAKTLPLANSRYDAFEKKCWADFYEFIKTSQEHFKNSYPTKPLVGYDSEPLPKGFFHRTLVILLFLLCLLRYKPVTEFLKLAYSCAVNPSQALKTLKQAYQLRKMEIADKLSFF